MKFLHKPVTKNPAYVSFGTRLREWMEWKNLSTKHLAIDTGYDESTIRRWLNFERTPDLLDIQVIADYFGTNPRCMLCNHDDTRCGPCPNPKPPPRCKPCQAPR